MPWQPHLFDRDLGFELVAQEQFEAPVQPETFDNEYWHMSIFEACLLIESLGDHPTLLSARAWLETQIPDWLVGVSHL